MLGHDVKYSGTLDDNQLFVIAKKEKGILLTRDFELYQYATTREVDAFYVEGGTEGERLAELSKRFKIELEIRMETSRCPKCNTRVKPMAKGRVDGKVEKSTFQHYDEFWRCPKCRKIYWQGAHWTKIRKTLNIAQKMVENSKKK
jgi:uncharacterized protein with PIN domain